MEFLIVWACITAIIAIVGIFFAGYKEQDGAGKREEAIVYTTLSAVCWPIILIVIMFGAPILAIYYLGRYIRNRR